MNFKHDSYTYPSRRNLVYGAHGMVATGQQLAAQAGLEMLKKGGNAVDAAIATAITLTVVEPTSNGIGGDAFAIVWHKGELTGLNASGPAGSRADGKKLKALGYESMPAHGVHAVTVPGAPSAWIALSEKFGRLPFEELFKPAINAANEGFAVPSVVALMWEQEAALHAKNDSDKPEFQAWFDTFTNNKKAPAAGEIWKCPVQAETLSELAGTKCESFYRGRLADKISEFLGKYDGDIIKSDLASYYPDWVKPVNVNYRGYDIWELPPNGHGIVALMALNILNGFSFENKECTDTYHKQLEAMKLAYVDGKRYVTDPAAMKVSVSQLLSESYAAKRRALIGAEAIMPEPGLPDSGGTVYLCTADDEGNMVSYIQSNYKLFGSGLAVPDTGIALHDRGFGFSLDETMENYIEPGKKPYHTIIPGFITKDGEAVGPFGVMGGYMQPQGHVQVVTNMVDFHLNPQQALNTPRWQWMGGKTIEVEPEFPKEIFEELKQKGHDIKYSSKYHTFGRGQIILKNPSGGYIAGTEPRADGAALGY